MEQYISICPVCGHVYGHSNVKTIPCGNCGKSETVESGYMKDAWEVMSSEEKGKVIASCKTKESVPLVYNDSSVSFFGNIYSNPGKTIRGLAAVFYLIIVAIGIFLGVATMVATEKILLGILIIVVVALLGYFSGLGLAAFGKLVENSTEIVKLLKDKQ